MQHYIAIDLESWVYPELPKFKQLNSDDRKSLDAGYIVDSTRRLLALLDNFDTKLTFFVIAELYEWYPDLIEEIYSAGHEIGYHTHTHTHICTGEVLKDEIAKSATFIRRFNPKGFQAPKVIFPKDGYQILSDSGFEYSSSVYFHDSTPLCFDGIKEIPVSTFRFLKCKSEQGLTLPRKMGLSLLKSELPFGSSYFMAILDKQGMDYFIRKYEDMNSAVVMFIHNWQIFPPQQSSFPSASYLILHPHYLPYTKNIKGVFTHLLGNYSFGKLSEFRN